MNGRMDGNEGREDLERSSLAGGFASFCCAVRQELQSIFRVGQELQSDSDVDFFAC